MKCGRSQSAFSLLELLIVVSIILIISAIAIPNLLKSRMAANEASAVGSLRTLNATCISYSTTYGTGFPLAISNMGPGKPATAANADLIDNLLVTGTKSGYTFTYVSGAPRGGKISTYAINANPVSPNQTGTRHFFTDQTGVIRYSYSGTATQASSPIA